MSDAPIGVPGPAAATPAAPAIAPALTPVAGARPRSAGRLPAPLSGRPAGGPPVGPRVARPGLRHRQRAVGTLLVAGGLVVGCAALLGRPAVVVVVLAAQIVITVLGPLLLPSADRWAVLGAVPAPLASLVLAAATGGHLGLHRLAVPALLVTAFAAATVLVIVTELVRAAADGGGEPVAAGQGRVERLSENLTVAVLALSPALLLAVPAGSGERRWWFALGVAGVAAGIGVRLGGSIVRAGGLSAGELLRSPHRAAELLRLPVARAVVVDVVVSVLALVVTGGLLDLGQVGSGDLWLPGVLALVATPMVLAGATTVLGLRAPLSAGVLASGLGLALSAPLALLLSVRHG